MSKVFSHLTTAVLIIDKYDGSHPLSNYLKSFFSADKKYGSKDRKSIAALCYAYFRTGFLKLGDTKEKILAGLFLSEKTSNPFLLQEKPHWNETIHLPLNQKLKVLKSETENLFPFFDELSDEINKDEFIVSLLEQPSFYLRIRPGKTKSVIQKLNTAGIPFEILEAECISLPQSYNTQALLNINKEVIVQDRNSQKVLNFIDNNFLQINLTDVWDCCAASGGKSILIYDKLKGNIRLTVSDIRESILISLKKRLAESGINIFRSFVADLRKATMESAEYFDIIICDAPCTGSGTWSRTPEQLHYFKKNKLNDYASLQKKIISNSVSALKNGGLYFYITCSVFKKENEEQVNFINNNFSLEFLFMEYLKGFTKKADTMFVSVFKKPDL